MLCFASYITPVHFLFSSRKRAGAVIFILLFLFLTSHILFAVTYYSKSGQSVPSTLTNWTTVADGTGSNPANFTSDGDVFIIQTGHSYTTTVAWNITGASTLQVEGTITFAHVVTLGTAASKIGNLTINSGGIVTANVQNVIAHASGAFTINSGGKYVLNYSTTNNATTVFNGIESFNATSTFEYQNHSLTLVSGITYGNFIWNASITSRTFPASITINGDLTIMTGTLNIDKDQIVGGNFNVQGGTLNVNTTGTVFTLTVTGNAIVSAGVLNIATGTVAGNMNVSGNLTISGGTLNVFATTNAGLINALTVTGNTIISSGTLDLNNAVNTSAGRLFIKGNLTVSGSGTLQRTQTGTVGSTGVYFDGSGAQSFIWTGSGVISTSSGGPGRRFYYKTAAGPTAINEEYSGSAAQTTVNGSEGAPLAGYAALPTTGSLINNVTITNASGVTLSTAKEINGTLTLTSGKLDIAANNLTIVSTGTTSGQSVNGYVYTSSTGSLIRNSVGVSEILFPVGTATAYSPAYITNTGTSDNFSVLAKSSITNALSANSGYVEREWNIIETTPGGSNVTLKLQWNIENENSLFERSATVQIGRWGGAAYTTTSTTVAGSNPYTATTTSGITSNFTSSNPYVVGNDFAFINPGEVAGLDGGFEEQSANPASNTTDYNAGNNPTDWTHFSLTTATRTTTGGRSGPQYATIAKNTAGAARLRSAPVTSTISQNAQYTYQLYYKCAANVTLMEAYLNSSGSITNGTASTFTTPLTTTSGSWVKLTGQVTSTNVAPDAYRYFQLRFSDNSTNSIDVDDIAVYQGGTVDITAPNPPTNAIIDMETPFSLYIKWTAASGGIDGGGYLVVRGTTDPTTAPNVNGIYAVGNAIGTGTVVYIGTGTSFTNGSNTSELAAGTTHYYRIYTYDKAFNYSSALTANGTTRALTTADYRYVGISTCGWASACWENYNGTIWVAATGVPGNNQNITTANIYIVAKTVLMDFGVDCNILVVTGSGGTLLFDNAISRTLTVRGDFENSGTINPLTTDATGTVRTHTWNDYGNFNNRGTITTSNDPDGTTATDFRRDLNLILLGGNTTFPGPGTLNLYYNLTVNKTANTNTVTLNNSVTMSNFTATNTVPAPQLVLTNGKLVLGNNSFTIQSNGSINQNAVAETDSYVVTDGTDNSLAGKVTLQSRAITPTTHKFPIGPSATSYNPVTLTISAGPVDHLSARTETGNDPALSNASNFVSRTWFLDETVAGGNTFTAKFQWNLSEEGVDFTPDRANAKVYHYVSSPCCQQETSSGLAGANPYTLDGTGISSFSPFFVGRAPPVALPVELLYFNGKKITEGTLLYWSTASETNNDYFMIERAVPSQPPPLGEALEWQAIGSMKGAGNSSTVRKYEFTDVELPLSTVAATFYYRLKQTDYDGKYKYSNTIVINFEEDVKTKSLFSLFPNPASLYIQTIFYSDEEKQMHMNISDVAGKIVKQDSFAVGEGINYRIIETGNLPNGFYHIILYSENSFVSGNFIRE